MQTLILLLILIPFQNQDDLPILRVGETVKGMIEDGDPVIHTGILDKNYTQAPTVGKRYLVQVSEPGNYTIEMKSLFFDTYLVLRDKEGKILAEDDDGFYGSHARLVFKGGNRKEVIYLDICALHGKRGMYELRLKKGKGEALSPLTKQKMTLKDAREKVQIFENKEGEESFNLAYALNTLAGLLQTQGKYDEAINLLQQAISLHEIQVQESTQTLVANFSSAEGNARSAAEAYRTAMGSPRIDDH